MKRRILAFLLSLTIMFSLTANGFPAHAEEIDPCTCGAVADENGVITHDAECPQYQENMEVPLTAEPVCDCGTETEVHADTCPLYKEPEEKKTEEGPVCNCGTETEVHADTCPLYQAPEESAGPVCNCGAETEIHADTCPCYVAPVDTAPVCNCTPVDGVHAESCPLYEAPADTTPVCNCTPVDGVHAESCPLYEAPADTTPVCNCTPVDGVHAETCPLYEKPEAPSEPQCTCGAVADENGVVTHAEGCELYEAPKCTCGEAVIDNGNGTFTHLEGCPLYEEPEMPELPDMDVIEPIYLGKNNFTAVASFLSSRIAAMPRMFAANLPFADTRDSGLNLTKDALVENGKYYINMEAFSMGDEYRVPTDIVFVLDESGTMQYPMEFEHFPLKTNKENFDMAEKNGNLTTFPKLYYLHTDGSYQPVYIEYNRSTGVYNYWRWPKGGPYFVFSSSGDGTVPDPSGDAENRFYWVTQTRMEAMTTTLTDFANKIAAKANGADGRPETADDVNHRVAIVGFSQYANDRTGGLQSMNSASGQENVKNAITKLAPSGQTSIDYGMQMANTILNDRGGDGQTRNRVIIALTDGAPSRYTDSSNSGMYDPAIANEAIRQADIAESQYGATVYSIGIFPGADDRDGGRQNGDETQKSNWFMQRLSSNTRFPQTPSYYLSAGNSEGLSHVFDQITEMIESTSSTTLGKEAVITDVVSDQFQLPANVSPSDIKLYTVPCIGVDDNGPIFDDGRMTPFTGSVSVHKESGSVTVSGFDYSANWCGLDSNRKPHGRKLVVRFEVEKNPLFLGGNNVYTNESAAVYENLQAVEHGENPVGLFNRPQVNVPFDDLNVKAPEKNVYLYDDLSLDALKAGVEVKIGNTVLKLGEANMGIDKNINDAYNEVTVTYLDAEGNEIASLNDLTEDTKYQVKVTVTPKKTTATDTVGTPAVPGQKAVEVTGQNKEKLNNIFVFKPVLKYKDDVGYYGGTAPAFDDNLTSALWKHGETLDTQVLMVGNEKVGEIAARPNLDFTDTPDEDKIDNSGNIKTKDDFYINVGVKLGDHDLVTEGFVTFDHECGQTGVDCQFDSSKGEFICHVKTCSLTINKDVVNAPDDAQDYVFHVTGPMNTDLTVVIHGDSSITIHDLPVGTFGVNELENWSWRCTVSGEGDVTLSEDDPNGSITITNTYDKNDKWLDGNTSCDNKWNVVTPHITED